MYLAELATAMQSLAIEQTNIDRVIAALQECTDGSWDAQFASDAAIAPPSFGGADSAATLGMHHDRAHQVMTETVTGIVADLTAFADGVHAAARLITDADESVAASLTDKQRAVELMNDAWLTSEGDSAYDRARNDQGGQD
ncbi:hypothetical protein I601_0348 [Nocardioides dokdonensis FR1436]|uniref:WXG domain conatining protein n=1 Tax=Nocardioides dokdonensis FR1436 TaxID=1300347 RepID=A0A1A9GGZ3_9ACTN|nr:hypothetical protein [Nocardioides dokdonensis]ANH36801.1 hypothetical protein I601_0348 [Nocardioides dokdonensis FR1436]